MDSPQVPPEQAPETITETVPLQTPSTPSSIWKKLAIIFGVITAAFVALLVYGFILGDSEDKDKQAITTETEQVLSQLKASQIDQVYADAHSELIKVTTKADIENFVSMFPEIKTYNSVNIENITNDEIDATVTGRLIIEKGNPMNFSIDLSKENDTWKLVYLDLKGKPTPLTENNIGTEDKTVTIKELIIGNNYDDNGVTVSNSTISPDTEIIYASVLTDNQTVEKISTELKFISLDSGNDTSIILPIQKSSSGLSSAVRGTFSKSEDKWVTGKYKVIATLSNGQTKEAEFEIK